jgi:hypothetical protein
VVPTNAEMEAALVSIDAAGAMLPSERWTGRCYVCGKTADLTEEHIPPRSAFNKERTRKISLDDMLGRDELEVPDSGEVTQGGIRGFTLCDSCNNLTGVRWGREYHEWAKSLVMLIQAIYSKHGDLDGMMGFPTATDVTFQPCIRPD